MVILLVFLASDNSGDRRWLQLGEPDFRGGLDRCNVVFHLYGKENIRRTCDGGRGKEGAFQITAYHSAVTSLSSNS